MPQYNSSKKHLVLISQHGISFLLASTQDQRGFPVLYGDLSEVPPLLLRVRGSRCSREPRDTRGFLRLFCEEQTNFDGPNRAFCRGKREVPVLSGWGIFGGLFHPLLRRQEFLLGITAPNFAALQPGGDQRGDQSKSCSSPSSLLYSSCSSSSLGLTGVPGLGRKKIYKTLLNQQ